MKKVWVLYASLLLACAVLACIVAILAYGYSLSQPKGGVARNIEELINIDVMVLYRDSLPKDGHNFHYYAAIYPPYINVSFEISEKGFRKWASAQGWEVSEIHKQDGPNIGLSLFENSDGEYIKVEPEDGLIFSKDVFDGKRLESNLDVVYDRSNGKAYYRYIVSD